MAEPVLGVLFDKDGTLFDFQATWGAWAEGMMLELAEGDRRRAASLGSLIGFEFESRRFDLDSPAIAGTPLDIARQLAEGLPDVGFAELLHRIVSSATQAPQCEAVPLGSVLAQLRALGLALGLATNDGEAPARAHLAAVGQAGAFDFVAGYDSGYGSKPEPGMCLEFAAATGLSLDSLLMVGDSLLDMKAGRAAGMRTIGVLTGVADEAELALLATAVLPDISHLPAWISAERQRCDALK